MKHKKPTLYSLIPWSMAGSGLLIALGNLIGLTNLQLPVFPVVQDIAGLVINSLFLLAVGFVPVAIGSLFKKA